VVGRDLGPGATAWRAGATAAGGVCPGSMARGATIAGVVAGLVPAVLVAAVVLADDAAPRGAQPPTTSLGREGGFPTRIRSVLAYDRGCGAPPVPEIMVTPGRLLVRLHWVPGDPWVIARDGHEWDALAVVMTRLRADPGLDAFGEVLVYPKAGVPYRDLIRAYEVADHAGFDAPRLLPPWASHLAPPVLPRVTLRAGVARVEAGHGASTSAEFATDDAGTAALAAWLAARSPMPAAPMCPGCPVRLVEVDGDATTRVSDVDRVEKALYEADLAPASPGSWRDL